MKNLILICSFIAAFFVCSCESKKDYVAHVSYTVYRGNKAYHYGKDIDVNNKNIKAFKYSLKGSNELYLDALFEHHVIYNGTCDVDLNSLIIEKK